jgi:hypothetical protein
MRFHVALLSVSRVSFAAGSHPKARSRNSSFGGFKAGLHRQLIVVPPRSPLL